MQFAAPVAADGGERDARGQFRAEPLWPQRRRAAIDEGGACAHQRFDRFVIAEALLQFLLALQQQLPAHVRGTIVRSQQ